MAILPVLAVALALLAISTPPQSDDRQPVAPAPQPIRVISSSHEVRFPHEVVLNLEAEAAHPITEVTLFYRLAQGQVNLFGYPKFEPGTRVTAAFRLKTEGPSYIPSGVDIEYYYKIVDENGTELETGKRSIEYRDPAFEWAELKKGDLVVIWHGLSRDRVEAVAGRVVQRLEGVKRVIGLEAVPPMKAVILSSRREAQVAFPVLSEAARRAHLYGGFAFGNYGLFMLAGLDEESMVHEATHLLLDRAVDSPLARMPAWLNEGLAMYFEADSHSRSALVERAVRDDALLRLGAMNTMPGRPEDVRMFYAQSWSLVKYIVDTFGEERMTALLGAANEGTRVERAVQEVYGISLREIERRWRTDVSGITTLEPRPDPGTVGTTFIFVGAVLIAALVWAYRWRSGRLEPSGPEGTEP